jgi:hypothetical protein
MLAPISIRRLTLCLTWGSSAFTVVTGAWMGGPGTHHWVGGSGLSSPGNWGQCAFQFFPQKMGQVPEVAFSGALPPKMAHLSTLKACPWVWTLPQGSLSEHCNQSLLPPILSLFLLKFLHMSSVHHTLGFQLGFLTFWIREIKLR